MEFLDGYSAIRADMQVAGLWSSASLIMSSVDLHFCHTILTFLFILGFSHIAGSSTFFFEFIPVV